MAHAQIAPRLFEPQQIQDKYREILRRVSLGQKNSEIAKDLNISTVTVCTAKNSKLGQAVLQRLHAEADARVIEVGRDIKRSAPLALEILNTLMGADETPANVRAKIGFGILDRAGFAPVQKTANLNSNLSPEQLQQLLERGAAAGVPIDTDTTTVDVEPVSDDELLRILNGEEDV